MRAGYPAHMGTSPARRTVHAPVLIEGLAPDAILALPRDHLDALVLIGRPIAFRAGTAHVLGQFRVDGPRLRVELAHIDGGGEGVLPTLWWLAGHIAAHRGLAEVEWLVHAVHCAAPNLKLRRLLERRGFTVRVIDGAETYHLVRPAG